MGRVKVPVQCYITGLNTEHYPSDEDIVEYFIIVNDKKVLLRFPLDFKFSSAVEENLHILQGLILNGKFPTEYYSALGPILSNEVLQKIINESIVPILPDEKIATLLKYLQSLQSFDGSNFNLPEGDEDNLARRLYFRNSRELSFYLFTLRSMGLIDGFDASSMMEGNQLTNINLTFLGLTKLIELSEDGPSSNRCFVAMSFSEKSRETRAAIKSTIDNLGFKPVLIDEINFDSDITINDALIAEIKACKFMVADFTDHKHGVYFETGYALGLKRPVIYACHNDDFENTHFDTNHYPHIIYNNLEELKEKLRAKINAWIKE